MSELSEKSLCTLELPRVLELLSQQAVSTEAKERALHLRPSADATEVARLLDETDAACQMMSLHGSPSFSAVKSVGEAMERAERGGSLNTRELLTVAGLLRAARQVRDYFTAQSDGKRSARETSQSDGKHSAQETSQTDGKHAARNPQNQDGRTVIDPLFSALRGNRFLEDKILRCIPDENTIADAASPELADIRRHMRLAQSKSRQILQKMISSPSYAKALQETIITQRDGRFVIPVKADYRASVPGLVHDVSASGATVFIEPMGVVQANNEFIELEAKEQKEIERILAELSADAAEHRRDIEQDYRHLVELDLIFARAELSYRMKAVRPELRTNGSIHLHRARHPLLSPDTAVPIDISIGESFDTLVITGPNTGGKTVSLKTLGLLTLMCQCGLHIPAGDRSAISVYERVLADIGDEQSIEQNLSTFSAHMVNIVSILGETDRNSLLLFDELGAGTDPVEGAALAIAVIEHVRAGGAKTVATTHYAELKSFAMTTPGVENASCEFDVETLAPTYRLITGIPGKSNAFAISRRLGLPEEIITAAQAQMSGESVRFEDILTRLEEKRQALEKRDAESERLYRQREEDAAKAREFREQMERAKDRARSRGEAEAKRIVRDAKAAADLAFAELDALRRTQEKGGLSAETSNESRATVRRLLREADDALHADDSIKEPVPRPVRPVQAGDFVEIPGVRIPAEVVSVERDGTLRLKAGAVNMNVKAEEVRLLEGSERTARKSKAGKGSSIYTPRTSVNATRFQGKGGTESSGNSAYTPRLTGAARELDIRGLETIEAESVVENFLSAAVMGHLETVVIIHGKGTGALRQAVRSMLKRNRSVKNFRPGIYGEGEDGVTVVTLK